MRIVLFSLGFFLLLAAGRSLCANPHLRPAAAANGGLMPIGMPRAACFALALLGAAALAAAYWP